MKKLTICLTQWVKSIKEHLNLSFEKGESYKKSHLVHMSAFAPSPAEGVDISNSLKLCFLRGLFEGYGCIGKYLTNDVYYLRFSISSCSIAMRMIVTFCRSSNINISTCPDKVVLSGKFAAKFFPKIYRRMQQQKICSQAKI